MEDEQIVEAVIGMNDHPFIAFNFDTPNFHSEDVKWFLESVSFDGCRYEHCPMQFYQDIIDFCQKRISAIPHYEVNGDKLEWIEEKNED